MGNEALWTAGISCLPYTHRHNVKERAFFSQQATAFVYVQSGMSLDVFWRVFSLKHVLRDEQTVTFEEYL